MAPKVAIHELSQHATPDNCWILVNGKVYDLTRFAPEHPGGAQAILMYAGKDGTETYNLYHSPEMIEKNLDRNEKKGEIDESTITKEWLKAQEAKAEAASDSNEKPLLETLINLHDFEEVFAKHGNPKGNAYVVGASNDCLTAEANKIYWQKLWFRPRVMRNVATVKTTSKLLGCDVRMPVFISPMGLAKTAGPQGETALGAGAAASGIIHCLSTAASMSIDDVLRSVPPTYPYFFQLYVDSQRHKTEVVLQQLEKRDQVRAIFVTVDLPVVSKREVDERMRTSEIVSAYSQSKSSSVDRKGGGLARSTGGFIDPALSWDDLPWIRRHTSKPIVVKGIQSAADARKALKMGCQGIVVSNHGGRALDSAPATILTLLEIRRDCPEVFDKMEVFVDGGIRRGSDILKAVCLGAQGVGVGRPFQCSVLYDKEGVEAAAAILQDELNTAMQLCGVTDLDAVRGNLSYLNAAEIQQFLPPKPTTRLWFFGMRSRL